MTTSADRPLASPVTADAVPLPGYVHPAYRRHAETIRALLGAHTATTFVPAPPPAPPTFVLTVRHAAGAAPYVGRPFQYRWKVATDDLGRSVAGPAWIEYLPPADPRFGEPSW